MSYLDDLKKKGQNLVQNVQNAGNAAKTLYNGVKNTAQNVGNTTKNVYNGVKNVYNAVQGAKQEYNDFKNYQSQQNLQPQQTAIEQQETDWLAEYDNYKAEEAQKQYSTGAQGATGGQVPNVTPAAQAALGEGAGQWKSELDGIMNKILNGEKFEYDMNGDAMYQQMADMHKNNANLAMQNAMAQAAAMTGGYGSSYGQMVGQQAFAGQMQGLNDIGMDLYNQALNEYIAEGDRLNNQYAMLAEREALDYNRGIDERNFEYQKGQDELAQKNYEGEFAYQKDRDAVSDSQWDKSFEYQQGRDDVADEQWSESMQYQKDRDAVADSQWEQSFGYQQDRDQVADEQWQAELDRYLANDKTAKEQWQAEMDRATANDKVAADQWDKQFASQEDQRAEDNAYRDKTFDYQQSRDKVSDSQWKAELDRMLANDEISQQQWQAEMDRALANDKLAAEQWNKSFAADEEQRGIDNAYRDATLAEDQRQFDESLDWDKAVQDYMYGENGFYNNQREDEQAYNTAEREASQEYQSGENALDREQDQNQFDDLYGEEGFYTKQNAQEQENWQAEFDREGEWYDDAQEAANPNTTYEGESALNGQSVPKQLAGVQGLTTTNPGLFDDNGYFKQAAVVSGSEKDLYGNPVAPTAGRGTMTYNIGGKNITVQTGTNPYTNTVNPDAKNGVMANGYQPTHYGKAEVKEIDGQYGVVNGQKVPAYTATVNGKKTTLVYDDANNEYIEVDSYELEDENSSTGNVTGGGGSGAGASSLGGKVNSNLMHTLK